MGTMKTACIQMLEPQQYEVDYPGEYMCLPCTRRFLTTELLKEHVESFHEKERFTCPHCKRDFSQKADVKRHIRAVHEKQRPYKCAECGLDFTQSGNLWRHMKFVHGKSRDCSILTHIASSAVNGSAVNNNTSASERLRSLANTNFSCPTCSVRFSSPKQLAKHRRNAHQATVSPSPFYCTECHKTFTKKSNLNKHWRCYHKQEPPRLQPQVISPALSTTIPSISPTMVAMQQSPTLVAMQQSPNTANNNNSIEIPLDLTTVKKELMFN